MNYIHLKHYHNSCTRFKHPLLDGCILVLEDDLNKMAEGILSGEDADELVLALRYSLSLLVGRYMANWPDSRPYVEDMVSEGISEIVRLCRNIPIELFMERGILKIATNRAQFGIEKMLNAMRALSAPSHATQLTRIKQNEDPIYLESLKHSQQEPGEDENRVDYAENCHPLDLGDISTRDIFDAFCKIVLEDEVDEFLMAEASWGQSNVALARQLGWARPSVEYRREKLYKKFLELME